MPYPYPYTYFRPTGKEQTALGIGSVLAGLLGAASGQNGGDAAVRGLAGLTGGYGAGYQNYQNMMGDAFQRDLYDKKYRQDVGQDAFRNDLLTKQYNQGVTEYEETEKPRGQAMTGYYDKLSNSSPSPEDIQYENEKRQLDIKGKRLDIRSKSKELRQGKSPLVSVNTGAFETEEQKGMGRVAVTNYENIQKDAATARNELDTYNELESLMSQTTTGSLEPFKTNIASYAQALGIATDDKWDANQAINAISNKLTIMARKVGEGQLLAGQISDSDREFLQASVPSLNKMEGSNKLIIGFAKKIAQRKLETAKFANDYYRKNGTLKGVDVAMEEWSKNNPLFGSVGQGVSAETGAQETKVLNGKTYTKVNGQWFEQ